MSPFDFQMSAEPGVILQERPAREGETDQPKKRPIGRTITSKVRTPEYMDTPKVVPGGIMSADMALAGQPKVIPMHVAPEL